MPPGQRPEALATLIERAHLAHKVSRRLGHAHPLWGNGCLASAVAGLAHRSEGHDPDPDQLESLAWWPLPSPDGNGGRRPSARGEAERRHLRKVNASLPLSAGVTMWYFRR